MTDSLARIVEEMRAWAVRFRVNGSQHGIATSLDEYTDRIAALSAPAGCVKPFPAPGLWFPVDVMGNPMREVSPGKWESWTLAAAPAVSGAGDGTEQCDVCLDEVRFCDHPTPPAAVSDPVAIDSSGPLQQIYTSVSDPVGEVAHARIVAEKDARIDHLAAMRSHHRARHKSYKRQHADAEQRAEAMAEEVARLSVRAETAERVCAALRGNVAALSDRLTGQATPEGSS